VVEPRSSEELRGARRSHFPCDMDELLGQVVEDRFVVEAELGAGAMGTVYRGRHVKLGRQVAIKVLHDHLLRDDTMVERFEREAHIAARLHHPNVTGVIDIGTTPSGRRLMVMELAPGVCLAEMVGAPLARERVVALARQLLRGLDHAHGVGLVHRDLKPENVIVEQTKDGEIARIVDFGIAILREPSPEMRRLTVAGTVIGTPMYMAPEQARGEDVDHRCDLFALGVILYQLLAGRPPFEGSGVEIMIANITRDAPPIADADSRLERFARMLMARDVRARFQTAYDALLALDLIDRDVELGRGTGQTLRFRAV